MLKKTFILMIALIISGGFLIHDIKSVQAFSLKETWNNFVTKDNIIEKGKKYIDKKCENKNNWLCAAADIILPDSNRKDEVDKKPDSDNAKDGQNSPSYGFGMTVNPNLAKEGDRITIRTVTINYDAPNITHIVLDPNKDAGSSGRTVCVALQEGWNQAIFPKTCTSGNCTAESQWTIPQSQNTNNYDIEVISLFGKKPLSEPCVPEDILQVSKSTLRVEKVIDNTNLDSVANAEIKGKISISASKSADLGANNAMQINTKFMGHKNDEFMLWITDCKGNYVPKILASDHAKRTITGDDFAYQYIWDFEAAGTQACKHTVQAKTFKNMNGIWKWNDMARYEIDVKNGKPQTRKVCIMQMDELSDTTIVDGNKGKTTGEVSESGNYVNLTWNQICEAKVYYIYRDGEVIAKTTETKFTDNEVTEGEYEYKIEAYFKEQADLNEQIQKRMEPVQGDYIENNDYMDRTSKIWKNIWVGLTNSILRAKAEKLNELAATAEKRVTVTSVSGAGDGKGAGGSVSMPQGSGQCPKGQVTLGVPIFSFEDRTFISCEESLEKYIQDLYGMFMVIASLGAVIMIIWGGYMYTTSAGQAAVISKAKEIIIGAITGLLLLMAAGLIISTIGYR